ncbi:hypothetical protein HanRHA438_Chr16g0739201 [Helianthus annuus]|nr:hypothetical protein HanRHA438_Chr16g0739201 [Helianthus annuus]
MTSGIFVPLFVQLFQCKSNFKFVSFLFLMFVKHANSVFLSQCLPSYVRSNFKFVSFPFLMFVKHANSVQNTKIESNNWTNHMDENDS